MDEHVVARFIRRATDPSVLRPLPHNLTEIQLRWRLRVKRRGSARMVATALIGA